MQQKIKIPNNTNKTAIANPLTNIWTDNRNTILTTLFIKLWHTHTHDRISSIYVPLAIFIIYASHLHKWPFHNHPNYIESNEMPIQNR